MRSGNGQPVVIVPTGILALPALAQAVEVSSSTTRMEPDLGVIQASVALLAEDDLAAADVVASSPWVFLDARGPKLFMANPMGELQGHVGTHPAILKHVLTPVLARDLTLQLRLRWPGSGQDPEAGQVPIVLVVFDHDGKHRSVAWSHWLTAFLAIMDYNPTVSLAATNFMDTCGQTGCPECGQAPQTSLLFEAMARLCAEP